MALASGTRLGPYEVESPLGAGGMGEVYLAMQSSLGRQVAIKVLSATFAADPDRLRRFEQEARAASALNHPNIISIYDVGREGAISYIAMEFVDGKTLRALLEAGPLPIKRTLQIATQIADGLARAHAAGIVHRDLKPENIMVTRDGYVKILDFGLAKLMSSVDASASTATMSVLATHPGVVMGTAGYMSPEQARGADVDYRSDIFSFGSILYEMVAGKQPFKGPSAAQTLAAIIEDEPPAVTEANPKTPTPLAWIIDRCLAKDPDDRYTSTRDLARDLQSIRDHLSDANVSSQIPQVAPAASSPKWLKTALFAVAGLTLGSILTAWLMPRPKSESVTFHTLTFSGNDLLPSVAPDGRTVAFVSDRDGHQRIWLKQLESGSENVLTPGPDDSNPRFSPDNAWVLYIHNRAVYRIPSLGGEPRKVLDNVDDANWSPDGKQIVFVHLELDGTKVTSVVGIGSVADGTANVIKRLEGRDLVEPAWSPDGSKIALTARRSGTVGTPIHHVILLNPDGNDLRELECPLPGGALSAATWASDSRSLMYEQPESLAETGFVLTSPVGSPGNVLLQDINTRKIKILFPVQAPVSRLEIAGPGRVIFDTLLQRNSLREIPLNPGPGSAPRWLTHGSSIDRQPYYSPDGQAIIFASSRGGDVDLWEVSTKTNSIRRLTDHPGADWDPFVTPDNKNILWSSSRSGNFEIWMSERDGSAPRQVSHDGGDAENPAAAGGWIVYASAQSGHPGLWKMRSDGSEAGVVVPGSVSWPDISPDGKYVLYHTLNGVLQGGINVVRLADGAPAEFKAQGRRARFAEDGHSIVYIDLNDNIVSKPFPSPADAPVKLLVPASADLATETFDLSPDGRHVVISYGQPTRSLMLATGVPDIKTK
jgi:eukaryotic-like serine/threonine-protein kinase